MSTNTEIIVQLTAATAAAAAREMHIDAEAIQARSRFRFEVRPSERQKIIKMMIDAGYEVVDIR